MNKKSKKLSIVISCIDYRFWPEALLILRKKYGDFDLIQLAGSIKNLLSSKKEHKITLLDHIEKAIKLHHPQKIILINHLDCGAYGGSKNFSSLKEEIKFHNQELKKAANIIKKKFPHLIIKKGFLLKNKKVKFSEIK